MALKVGDKCPQCREGLLERTELGISCDGCSFEIEIAEVVAANAASKVTAENYRYRPARVSIRIEDPEAGEEFLRGLILARQNNNSPLFPELIDGINELLQPWRAARLADTMSSRRAAGMP